MVTAVNSAASRTCRIAFIVVWSAICFAQTLDLAPLLPAPTPATDAIRQALLTGRILHATNLADSLAPETRKLWRGILAIVRNDPTSAIRTLRHADQPKVLGVAYYLERQYLLFRDQMAQAIRQDSADFGPYYYLGRHYDSDVDDAEQASRWYREALQRNPDYARARSHLGNCLERLGRTEEAQANYEASAALSLSQLGLGRLMLAAGEPAAALSFVGKALVIDPRDPAALKLSARIYMELNCPGDAARALARAVAASPRDPSTQYQLYRAWQSLGNATKAAAALAEFERLRAVYGLQQ
jgi:tetratricopeptide (TPR) repeat protein